MLYSLFALLPQCHDWSAAPTSACLCRGPHTAAFTMYVVLMANRWQHRAYEWSNIFHLHPPINGEHEVGYTANTVFQVCSMTWPGSNPFSQLWWRVINPMHPSAGPKPVFNFLIFKCQESKFHTFYFINKLDLPVLVQDKKDILSGSYTLYLNSISLIRANIFAAFDQLLNRGKIAQPILCHFYSISYSLASTCSCMLWLCAKALQAIQIK